MASAELLALKDRCGITSVTKEWVREGSSWRRYSHILLDAGRLRIDEQPLGRISDTCSGFEAAIFGRECAARPKACPDTNLHGEGKMPSRQPAGRRRYGRGEGFAQGGLPGLLSSCGGLHTFGGLFDKGCDRLWLRHWRAARGCCLPGFIGPSGGPESL